MLILLPETLDVCDSSVVWLDISTIDLLTKTAALTPPVKSPHTTACTANEHCRFSCVKSPVQVAVTADVIAGHRPQLVAMIL